MDAGAVFAVGFVAGMSMLGIWLGFRGLLQGFKKPGKIEPGTEKTQHGSEPEKRKRGRPPKTETKVLEATKDSKGGLFSKKENKKEPDF